MPNYRSIDISLHSQFDVDILPEYCPLPQEHYTERHIAHTAPEYVDDASSTCSVYVPVYPGSMFWIGYSVMPPVPDGHYFLFKLYINGAHIVSWSTGKEEEWKGKTMFGLYERPEDEEGKRKIERRVLCFATDNDDPMWGLGTAAFDERMRMEIRVHRAHGRKRMEREMETYSATQHASNARGIDLINAGRASPEQPKRFYKFALIDPIDQPFATFRYFYRTWDQLKYLGVVEDERDEETGVTDCDLPVIEPCEDNFDREDRRIASCAVEDLEDLFLECGASMSEPSQRSTDAYEAPRGYVPSGAPSTTTSTSADASDEQAAKQTRQRYSGMRTPLQRYRLSMPPSVKLVPPQPCSRPQHAGPHKSDTSFSSTSYRPHPAYPVEEWRQRTPSPVKSIREGITTPPLGKAKHGFRASSLVNVFTSTWKRRAASASGSSGGADRQGGARSISH